MIDPYLYPGTNILKNLLGIQDRAIDMAEADYTSSRLKEIVAQTLPGKYDFAHLCKFHEYIFQDIYDWAGVPRVINIEKEERALGGLSIEYTTFDNIEKESKNILDKMTSISWRKLNVTERANRLSGSIAALWKIHPFREGNTRTVITFCCQYYEAQGLKLNRKLLEQNSGYVRDSLVAASAVFNDLGNLSKPQFLNRIIFDAIKDNGKVFSIEP